MLCVFIQLLKRFITCCSIALYVVFQTLFRNQTQAFQLGWICFHPQIDRKTKQKKSVKGEKTFLSLDVYHGHSKGGCRRIIGIQLYFFHFFFESETSRFFTKQRHRSSLSNSKSQPPRNKEMGKKCYVKSLSWQIVFLWRIPFMYTEYCVALAIILMSFSPNCSRVVGKVH